jgi:hypothetical protein
MTRSNYPTIASCWSAGKWVICGRVCGFVGEGKTTIYYSLGTILYSRPSQGCITNTRELLDAVFRDKYLYVLIIKKS